MRNRNIGFVFQGFNLLKRMTALDNVATPLLYAGVSRAESRKRALELLDQTGLAKFAAYQPSQLSGGQQQRVAISRALVNNPPLILADEPTGNLDTQTSREIMAVFQQLNREQGITIVLVTHEDDIAAYTQRLVRLQGRTHRARRGNVRMNLLAIIGEALRALRLNRLRTGLTMLGMIIGVAAVVLMLAVGQGAQTTVNQAISSMGSNLLLVVPGATSSGALRSGSRRRCKH